MSKIQVMESCPRMKLKLKVDVIVPRLKKSKLQKIQNGIFSDPYILKKERFTQNYKQKHLIFFKFKNKINKMY